VTSAEEFPEETPVPPAVLYTPMQPVGGIVTIDQTTQNDLRLAFRVRDENLEDVLEYEARLSVGGAPPYYFICPPGQINPIAGNPVREVVELVIEPQKLKAGACTKVEVIVSKTFAGGCIGAPVEPEDSARATYWIWETSGLTAMDTGAPEELLTSCETMTSAQGTPTSMVQ
jgi:hypothetical protein